MRRSFTNSLRILEKYTPRYDLRKKTIGVVTAGDSNVFDGIQILHSSLKNKINFLCYDIGFTDLQRQWAKQNNMPVKQINIDSYVKQINKWQTFLKPWVVDDSPFDYTIWIDSDCIAVGDLSKSPYILRKKTFFVQHWIHQSMLRKNAEKLYEEYPVKNQNIPYINAGVFGINKKRNQQIIWDWKNLLKYCLYKDNSLLDCLANWDEGALNWSIQKNQAERFIKDEYTHNCFTDFIWNHNDRLFDTYHQKVFLYEGSLAFPNLFFRKILLANEPLILHFSTCMDNKKKYWSVWDNTVNKMLKKD